MLDEPTKYNRLLGDFLSLNSGESPRDLQLKDEWKRRDISLKGRILDTASSCAYNPHASFLDSSIRQSGRLLTARFQVRVLVEEAYDTPRRRSVFY